MSDENSACLVSVKHNTLSDGDVKVCVLYGSASYSGWGTVIGFVKFIARNQGPLHYPHPCHFWGCHVPEVYAAYLNRFLA